MEEETESPFQKLPASNCEVEEAWRPWVKYKGVEVELAAAPKLVVGVKGNAAVRPAPVT